MTRRLRAIIAASLLASAFLACRSSDDSLTPLGEALVVVDTDLPAELASRLRVDLYAEDGRWFESRDIGRPDRRDWPASFSVYSSDELEPRRVLVRIRVHPEGVTRDYLGERYEARVPYSLPPIGTSLAEICATAPELSLDARPVEVRVGETPITTVVSDPDRCSREIGAGSAALRVTIPKRGSYRFYVSNAVPYSTYATLSLRSRCDDPASQIVCQMEPHGGNVFTPGHFPRFDATLDPGTYWLFASSEAVSWSAHLDLEAMPADDAAFSDLAARASESSSSASNPGALPRLAPLPDANEPGDASASTSAGTPSDATPRAEPVPSATIDRLVLLRLVPGKRGRVLVKLRGACVGTMARLGSDPLRPNIDTAATCIDREGELSPLTESSIEEGNLSRTTGSSLLGTFGIGEDCSASAPVDPSRPVSARNPVCIPGGAFLFGSRLVSGGSNIGALSSPERIAVMPRFWMDRYEVTVGRLRDAVNRGFVLPSSEIYDNARSIPTMDGSPSDSFDDYCSWSTTLTNVRESFGVTCINWRLARAFCQYEGGDLPTEAEWEYAASAAGRPYKTRFPWGNERPRCDQAVVERSPVFVGSRRCASSVAGRIGPAPVDAAPFDTTPQGVVGLAGGSDEWVLDFAQPYANPCWQASPLMSPRCYEDFAPMHSVRGGSWPGEATTSFERTVVPSAAAAHGIAETQSSTPALSFRCVYRTEPPR